MNFYDKQGNEISIEFWRVLFNSSYQRVAITHIPNFPVNNSDKKETIDISTVWIGVDHSIVGRKIIIFETMMFGGPEDEYQERYSTLDQAIEGHLKVVKEQLKYVNR